jgi:DNA modification methylase
MELEKYKEFKSALAVAETFEELKFLESKAAAAAEFAKRNKIGLEIQNEWGKFRVEIEAKKGAWLDIQFPSKKHSSSRMKDEGVSFKESSSARLINKEPELCNKIIDEIILSGNVVTPNAVSSGIRKERKETSFKYKRAENIEESKKEIEVMPEVSLMDCNNFLQSFPDDSIDLLFTDPPYSTDVADINAFTESWLPLAIKKTKKSGRMLIFSGAYAKEMEAFLSVFAKQSKFIYDFPLVWCYKNTLAKTPKMHHNLNYQLIWELYSKESSPLDTSITGEMFSVMEMNAPDGRLGNKFHAWQKPDELARRLIRHTTKKDDLVVDPFVCTGTFVLEANRLKRVGKGCDNNQANLDIAISRGCNLIIHEDETTATEDDVANSTVIFKADLPSTEQNKTHDSVEHNAKEKSDDLLDINGDVVEVNEYLGLSRIEESDALILQPTKDEYTKPLSKKINLHNSTRRKTKATVQSKD